MRRVSYVNGRYVDHHDAGVHIEDRGLLFADSIYEVILVRDGIQIDGLRHFERLQNSAKEISLELSFSKSSLDIIIKQLMRQNRRTSSAIYIQVTRGSAPRTHEFPNKPIRNSLIVMALKMPQPIKLYNEGAKVILSPEIRWKRKNIKSNSLLPNVLAKQEAKESGAKEVWFYDQQNHILEGSATNAFMIKNNEVITHPETNEILGGITRKRILELCAAKKIKHCERKFTISELLEANEAFYSASTQFLVPVVKIDDSIIGDGKPGKMTQFLLSAYEEFVVKQLEGEYAN